MPQGMDPKGKLKGVGRHNNEWNRLIQDKANKDTARTESYTKDMEDWMPLIKARHGLATGDEVDFIDRARWKMGIPRHSASRNAEHASVMGGYRAAGYGKGESVFDRNRKR